MKRKIKAPVIVTTTGAVLIATSYLIDKLITSGFLARVNSDTFGVGLALTVAGLIWMFFKFKTP